MFFLSCPTGGLLVLDSGGSRLTYRRPPSFLSTAPSVSALGQLVSFTLGCPLLESLGDTLRENWFPLCISVAPAGGAERPLFSRWGVRIPGPALHTPAEPPHPPLPGPQTTPLQDEGSGLDDFGTFFSLEILPFRWGGIVASCQGCTCGRCLGLFGNRFSCVPSLSFCPERSGLFLLATYFAKQSVSHRCTRAHRECEGGSYVERLPFSFPESSSTFTLEGRLFPPTP